MSENHVRFAVCEKRDIVDQIPQHVYDAINAYMYETCDEFTIVAFVADVAKPAHNTYHVRIFFIDEENCDEYTTYMYLVTFVHDEQNTTITKVVNMHNVGDAM